MTDTLHPCVRPRRRFVLAFLGVCLLLVLMDFAQIGTFKLDFYAVFLVELLLLALPSRTSYGTLMQLVGLVMPGCGVVIIGFSILEEMGVYFPHWEYMVMYPVALTFWVGMVPYLLIWACVSLWYKATKQKSQTDL